MRNFRRSSRAIGLLVLILSTACGGSSPTRPEAVSSALGSLQANKAIRAGWAPYEPYSSLDPATRRPHGFYIELFEAVAREGGFKVEWVETTWGTMISDLKSGKFEVMASPVFRTIPRALEVSFTRPVDFFGYSAIVRKGENRFHQIGDFNRPDVRLAVTQGEVGHEFAQRHLPKSQLVVHKTGDIALALTDVLQGKADAGICDAWTAKQFAAQHGDAVVDLFAEHPFNVVGAGWFVAPREIELLNFLNTSLDWLESSGEIRATASRYQLPSFLNPGATQPVSSRQ